MPSFGVIYNKAHGHGVTAILCAMVAMLFTSLSYRCKARTNLHGGSAFLYVSRELHTGLGHLTRPHCRNRVGFGWNSVLGFFQA